MSPEIKIKKNNLKIKICVAFVLFIVQI